MSATEPTPDEIRSEALRERHDRRARETDRHVGNLEYEERRYRAGLADIERVFQLRVSSVINPDCTRCSGGPPKICACREPCAFRGCGARQ